MDSEQNNTGEQLAQSQQQSLSTDDLSRAFERSCMEGIAKMEVEPSDETERQKCRRLARFVSSEQDINEPASVEEIREALELADSLQQWANKKSASYEEIIAKHYVRSLLGSGYCPIAKCVDRVIEEKSTKPNHRPSASYQELCKTFAYAKAHNDNISQTARHFNVTPKAIRERLNRLTEKVNQMFAPNLKAPLASHKDLLNMQNENVLECLLNGYRKFYKKTK